MKSEKYLEEKLKYTTEYAVNFDERIIYLFSELDASIGTLLRLRFDLIKLWLKEVEGLPITDITIDISSYGGSIDSVNGALDFYHELGSKGILINTRAQGICMSAATVLLAAGTGERTAYPSTKFLLHDLQCEGVEGTAQQIKSTVKTISDEQLEFFSYYAKFANKEKTFTDKELKAESKKWIKIYTKGAIDYYLSAEKMLGLKLIDRVL
jgi:ATP-dependent protease ClpP protease subunit